MNYFATTCACLALTTAARADVPADHNFKIEPQALTSALVEFSRQADVQVVGATEAIGTARTSGVAGRLTGVQALERLLRGTSLSPHWTGQGTVTITAARAETSMGDGSADSITRWRAADQGPGRDVSSEASGSQTKADTDEPAQGKKPDAGIPEILVKGSRIMNVDVVRSEDDVQAYTILDSAKIEQSGATNVEEFLKQQLTMNTLSATNAQTFQSSSGATSSINLRGLGTNETLILIDGRRTAGVSLFGSAAQSDINGIPLSAIERIEVLPSSASAIYGGAAVGGVVNIILKKDFDGGEVHYTYDRAGAGSADQRLLSASYGTSLFDGNTRIMVGGQYADSDPLRLRDRQQWVSRGISRILGNSPGYLYNASNPFQGSVPNIASADGSFNPDFTVFTQTPLTLLNGTPLNSPITSIPARAGAGSNLSSGLVANAGKYNLNLARGNGEYGLSSPFGATPVTRSVFATLRQTVFDDVQLFTELSTSSNKSHAVSNPFAQAFGVPAGAPTNPFQQNVIVTFPSNVGAPFDTDSVTHSATLGVVLPLAHGWSSEADYTWSKNLFDYSSYLADTTAFGNALADGSVNPFVDTLLHPLNLAPYLVRNTYSATSTLNDVNLRASGSLGRLPAGQPTLTIGLEHRKEGIGDARLNQSYPLTPENTVQEIFFAQSQSTDSVYVEALVPLIAPQNGISGVHSLDLQLAGRSERYTVQAGTAYAYLAPIAYQSFNPPQGAHATVKYTSTNPTIGLKFSPVRDVTLRASYSTAFLPPTAAQLLPDPTPVCSGGAPCYPIVDPVTGQSYFTNINGGGNPKLHPQTSRNWDLGVIWEPRQEALQGLRLNVEYYHIVQPNYITVPTGQQVVANPALAKRVTRDPATGLISNIDTSFVNAAVYKTSGFDVKIDYSRPTSLGVFGLHAAGTVIEHDLRQYALGSPFLEFAGYPHDGGEGKIKANATVDWNYHGWNAAWTATYYSNYRQVFSPGSPTYIQSGGSYTGITDAQGGFTIPSQIYHDVYASYVFDKVAPHTHLADLLANLSIQFGIRNVFNTLPPFDAAVVPYFYSTYGDPRLRDYRISIKKEF